MINNMVSEWNLGQMVPNMKVITLTERKKERVNLLLQTVVFMKVNLNKMKFAVKGNIIGQMVSNIKDNGAKIRCTDKVL